MKARGSNTRKAGGGGGCVAATCGWRGLHSEPQVRQNFRDPPSTERMFTQKSQKFCPHLAQAKRARVRGWNLQNTLATLGSGGAIGGWTCNEPTEADPSCGAPDSKRMTISPIRINWPVSSFVIST